MEAQLKTERLLRLMQMLAGPVEYTIDELSDRLEMSVRTIYRYLNTFEDVGFTVRRGSNVPRLLTTNRRNLSIDDLVCFSREEAALVNQLLDRLDAGNALKASLKEKLIAVCDQTPVARLLTNKDNSEKLNLLSDAIHDKKKVVLHQYESGNSLTVRDRFIEPFTFTPNFIGIIGYEPESGMCKTFTINRIHEVEVLGDGWEFEDLHKEKPTDIFRLSADRPLERIKLSMTSLAKNLLLEEYPLSAAYITEVPAPEHDSKAKWILETDICGVAGAGRFVMGLASDVQVLEGRHLKDYIAAVTEKVLLPEYLGGAM
ncbi:MAG: WYL domain-containing protein [Bacteroidales bacterium]|nr:WYL domain-containing protein [Bacteroidales bacterium]